VARTSNRKQDVTGALLTHGDWFVQALEGQEATVRALYERIHRDRRHEKITVIFAEPCRIGCSRGGRWRGCPTTASRTSRC
jgi:hypothetical protein